MRDFARLLYWDVHWRVGALFVFCNFCSRLLCGASCLVWCVVVACWRVGVGLVGVSRLVYRASCVGVAALACWPMGSLGFSFLPVLPVSRPPPPGPIFSVFIWIAISWRVVVQFCVFFFTRGCFTSFFFIFSAFIILGCLSFLARGCFAFFSFACLFPSPQGHFCIFYIPGSILHFFQYVAGQRFPAS